MLWINFLHLYQPANSDDFEIRKASEWSYSRIATALEKHPQIKFTLNITGCLLTRMEETGLSDLISRYAELVKKKQIELVGTAAYHPLLPLISKKEAKSQIKENETLLKKYFGKDLILKGFFMPEMAYGHEAAKLIKSLGYEWLILDEISYKGKLGAVDTGKIYEDRRSGLKIIFRSRKISESFVPDTLLSFLADERKKPETIITATDGELYGLRHNDPTGEFEKLMGSRQLSTSTMSEYINSTTKPVSASLVPSSWESTEKELKDKMPYGIWQNKKNKIQTALWRLAALASKAVEENKNDKNYYYMRWHLVRGLASCTFWWASGRDFRKVFGPVSWDPDKIERGINELVRSIRSLDTKKSVSLKLHAERLNILLRKSVWETHWKKHWKK